MTHKNQYLHLLYTYMYNSDKIKLNNSFISGKWHTVDIYKCIFKTRSFLIQPVAFINMNTYTVLAFFQVFFSDSMHNKFQACIKIYIKHDRYIVYLYKYNIYNLYRECKFDKTTVNYQKQITTEEHEQQFYTLNKAMKQ